MKYKLIKEFPKSPSLNTIISDENDYGNYRLLDNPSNEYYQFEHDEVEDYPEFWEVYHKSHLKDVDSMWDEIFTFLCDTCDTSNYSKDWNNLMLAYTQLCDKLPFRFCTVSGNIVYGTYVDKENNIDIYGEIKSNLFDSIFYIVSNMCAAYNKKLLPIIYE